jgi:threonine/homoserine/homoserine lactone efflux protein
MPSSASWIAFALITFGMVLTPGPNMIYLISRSICQGPLAGLTSLAGVATGFIIYMMAAALGLSALLLTVPIAYDVLRLAGAAYLAYLAWNALKPGGRSAFQVRELQADPPWKLYAMGLMTCLLNPKVAMIYISLLPQFVDPARGHPLMQSLILGFTQIAISVAGNSFFALTAGSVALFLARKPFWAKAQRWLMGTVLAALAVRMVFAAQR